MCMKELGGGDKTERSKPVPQFPCGRGSKFVRGTPGRRLVQVPELCCRGHALTPPMPAASTVDAVTVMRISDRIRSAGGQYLEAPVSGSKGPAEQGQLIFLAAGDEELFERVQHPLEVMRSCTSLSGWWWEFVTMDQSMGRCSAEAKQLPHAALITDVYRRLASFPGLLTRSLPTSACVGHNGG